MTRDEIATEGLESRALTGLRGAAALLVMLHHFYLKLGLDQHLPLLQFLLRKGYLGVDLFFVLSGFVLAMVYGRWFDGTRPFTMESYGRFMVRRVARLWPLHAAVLLVLMVFDLDPPHLNLTPRLVFANVAMIQAWNLSANINPPAWSISTEFLAYLLFPAMAALGLRGRAGPLACIGLAIAAIVACMWLAPPLGPARRGLMDIYYNYSPLPPLRCLAGVLTGIAAWRAGQAPLVRRIASLPWAGPLALLVFVAMLLGRVNDLLILPILPLAVLGMHYGSGAVHRIFAEGPVYRLGVLSYAIYLIHVTVLDQFPFGFAPLRYMLALYFIATIMVALAVHHVIEVPGRQLLRAMGESVLAALWPPDGRRTATIPPLQDDAR